MSSLNSSFGSIHYTNRPGPNYLLRELVPGIENFDQPIVPSIDTRMTTTTTTTATTTTSSITSPPTPERQTSLPPPPPAVASTGRSPRSRSRATIFKIEKKSSSSASPPPYIRVEAWACSSAGDGHVVTNSNNNNSIVTARSRIPTLRFKKDSRGKWVFAGRSDPRPALKVKLLRGEDGRWARIVRVA